MTRERGDFFLREFTRVPTGVLEDATAVAKDRCEGLLRREDAAGGALSQ